MLIVFHKTLTRKKSILNLQLSNERLLHLEFIIIFHTHILASLIKVSEQRKSEPAALR